MLSEAFKIVLMKDGHFILFHQKDNLGVNILLLKYDVIYSCVIAPILFSKVKCAVIKSPGSCSLD